MSKRGNTRYIRADTGLPLTDEDTYTIVMLNQRQRMPVDKIARRYGLTSSQVRDLLGRRSSGGCCG